MDSREGGNDIQVRGNDIQAMTSRRARAFFVWGELMNQYIDPRGKLYHHLDRLAALKAGRNPPPVNLEIDLSNRCSRGCSFCHFAYTHSRGPLAGMMPMVGGEGTGDLMDTALALRLMVDLEMYGVRSVTWTGGGEPTLHPEFNVIVRATRLDQGLYTHGGHIDEERAALLKERCRWVYVSLDYADAASYARGKGVGEKAFGESLAGIRRLAAAEGEATIGVGFLLNRENYRQAWQMLELSWDLEVDYVQFRPTVYYDETSPGEPPEDRGWMDDVFFRQMKRLAMRSEVTLDLSRFEMYHHWEAHGYRTCWWSGLQAVITPDGRVWACVNKRGFPAAAMGDLNRETFGKIWERAPIQKVDEQCRVLCRGHVPNLVLGPMMGTEGSHKNFI